MEYEFEKTRFMRVAKVAPYLRTLDLHMVDTISPCVKSMVEMVLKGDRIVKSLHTFPNCTNKMQNYTRKLLTKFLPTLRNIKFSWNNGDKFSLSAKFYGVVNEFLQIIADAPMLNYLMLDLHNITSFKGYKGQLGEGCVKLKQFAVLNYRSASGSDVDAIILDVLRNKKNQLVHVGFDSELSENVTKALSECRGLTKCHLLLANVPLIESMNQLAELEIGLSLATSPHTYSTAVESFIKSSNVLTNISKLTLWGRMNLFRISFLDKSANTVLSLTHKCQNVTVLKLVDITLPGNVFESFFTNLQNLEELFLETCGGVKDHHINQLCELSRLRIVDMDNLSVQKEEDIINLESAFESLRLSKPNAVITLKSCDLSPFGEESDYDEYGTDDEDDIYDEYNFTYYDYLRNKYGDEISDMDLWALASDDEM